MKSYFDEEDMKQESLAYMKTKIFMAKRISEQQNEIELLRDQLMMMNIKYMQLYEANKLLSTSKDQFNTSNSELANSLLLECDKEKDHGVLACNSDFSPDYAFEDKKAEKLLNLLKLENIELNKDVESLKVECCNKDLIISKLTNDRLMLYTELSELIMSLKKLNLEVFNKFYKETVRPATITSCLGIKINILSALSELSMLTMDTNSAINISSCMYAVKKIEEELNI
jgi:hypothetical protein